MDYNLLENLLFSDKIEAKTAQTLLDTYSAKYMTNRIARNLQAMGLTINLEIFNATWECLDEFDKQKLMLEQLELLDSDVLHSCFTDLEKWYSDFLERSKQRVIRLVNTPENQRLAKRLNEVEYITSYQLKKKKEYDSVTKTERVMTVILCRIKAIK